MIINRLELSNIGVFGNPGQSDYGAANEILNRMACRIDRTSSARVLSLNWGPWEGTGMVSPEVAEQFKSRGVDLIRIPDGRLAVTDAFLGAFGERLGLAPSAP